jgi:hypothetical protein
METGTDTTDASPERAIFRPFRPAADVKVIVPFEFMPAITALGFKTND